jgi:hypothetical protein
VLNRVMKQHCVSGTNRFWSRARTFAWSEPGCTVPSRSDPVSSQLKTLNLTKLAATPRLIWHYFQ